MPLLTERSRQVAHCPGAGQDGTTGRPGAAVPGPPTSGCWPGPVPVHDDSGVTRLHVCWVRARASTTESPPGRVAGRLTAWSKAWPEVENGGYAQPRRWWVDDSVAI